MLNAFEDSAIKLEFSNMAKNRFLEPRFEITALRYETWPTHPFPVTHHGRR